MEGRSFYVTTRNLAAACPDATVTPAYDRNKFKDETFAIKCLDVVEEVRVHVLVVRVLINVLLPSGNYDLWIHLLNGMRLPYHVHIELVLSFRSNVAALFLWSPSG